MILMNHAMMGAAGYQAASGGDLCMEFSATEGSGAQRSDSSFSLTAFTLSFWVKPTQIATNDVEQPIKKIENYEFSLAHSNPNFVNAFAIKRLSDWFPLRVLSPIPLGEWVFLALTYANNASRIAYHNGVLDNSESSPQSINSSTSSVFEINASGQEASCMLDNIRVDSRVLTAGEILDLYNNKNAMMHADSLVALYTFDDGVLGQSETGIITDTSGNDRHLTTRNNPVYREF